jgi:hypothetical protein
MTEPSADATGDNVTQTTDHSHVEQQIGVVHGDVNFYKMTGTETPAEKFRVGRNYLAGNMPRQAEKLIREAFVEGLRSTQVSYYWSLAVLSNRSFDHLTDEEFDQLDNAFDEIDQHPTDEWLVALAVVAGLVESLVAQEEQPEVDPERFDVALDRFAALPSARRDEVQRHLEMMLAGELQDRLEAEHAAEMRAKRMSDDRQRRVRKFFQPKSEPPRLLRPPEVESRTRDMAVIGGGAALVLLAVYLGGHLLLGASIALLVLSVVCYGGGAYAMVRYGLPRWAREVRTSWVAARFRGHRWSGARNDLREAGQPDARRVQFAAEVQERVDHWFEVNRRPTNARTVSTWMQESTGIRTTLAREFAEQYGFRIPLPQVESLDWLIRWHADAQFAKWEQGKLRDDRALAEVPTDLRVGSVLGPVGLGVSVLLTLFNAIELSTFTGFLAGAAWALGNGGVWAGAVLLHRTRSLARWLDDEMHRRKLQEDKAYADFYRSLDDRPTDAEIAAWLDYDKAFIKALAMKHTGLANRDLIAHVVLAGPARTARYAARVLYGPLRYSAYTVQVFLLTAGGVREVAVDLYLFSGAIANERRRSFGYNAISSAVVSEDGLEMDGMRIGGPGEERDTSELDEHRRRKDGDKLVFSQQFQLTLNNLEAVRLVVGNFDEGLIDRVLEDPRHLFELARDTSGVTPALRILEAIAAEGSDWVNQERLRRQRRIRDYQRKRGLTPALPAGSGNGAADVPEQRIAGRRAVAELE